jgi:hypothetical protein
MDVELTLAAVTLGSTRAAAARHRSSARCRRGTAPLASVRVSKAATGRTREVPMRISAGWSMFSRVVVTLSRST